MSIQLAVSFTVEIINPEMEKAVINAIEDHLVRKILYVHNPTSPLGNFTQEELRFWAQNLQIERI